jgi:putative colanic acid biosynthesis acetyltransferase WcaF
VLVRPSVKVTYPLKVTLSDFALLGDEVVLYSLGEIEIGVNAVVSQRSYLCAASHDYTQPDFPIYSKKVCIGAQAWLATDVFVAPRVTVGDGAVVGARSSVFHDLPPMMVCVGCPAKPIKYRNIAT